MFGELKEKFIEELVLAAPNLDNNKKRIEVDALDYVIRSVKSNLDRYHIYWACL